MPNIQRISTMKSMVIGVSFMKGEQEDILKAVWEDRFAGNQLNAVLVENNQEVADVYDNLCDVLSDLEITQVDQNVIVAAFLDMTDPEQAALASEMDTLQADIEDVIAQNVLEFIIFDHVGAYRRSFRKPDEKQNLRDQIQQSVYADKRTFLVGRNPLVKAEESWKAEVALLDVLARGDIQTSTFLLGGTVGFLRYGDSNQGLRAKLTHRLEQLDRLLSSEGEDDLKRNLDQYIEKHLKAPIHDACFPVPGVFPVPETLLTKAGMFSKISKDDRASAINQTRKAVEETMTCVSDYMKQQRDELKEKAGEILKELMDHSNVGIQMMQDIQAGKRIFTPGNKPVSFTGLNLENLTKIEEIEIEINRYMTAFYERELASVIVDFVEAVGDAYGQLSFEDLEKLRMEYENEKELISGKLSKLPEVTNFCKEAINGQHYASAFSPKNADVAAIANRVLLFSGQEMLNSVSAQGIPQDLTPIFYEPISGYESAEALSTFLYTNIANQMDQILHELIVG